MIRPLKNKYKNLRCFCIFAALLFCLIGQPKDAHAQGACWMTCVPAGCWTDNVGPSPPAFWICPVGNNTQQLIEKIAEWGQKVAYYAAQVEDWLTKNVTQNSIAPSIMSGIGIQTQAQVFMTQAQIDGMRQAHTADAVGNIAQATNMGQSSIVCATAKGYQARGAAMDIVNNMQRASQTMEAAVGVGASASGSATASASAEVNDLCALGFLGAPGAQSTRYGTLTATKNCGDPAIPAKYVDSDMRISSVIDPLQYPLPDKDHVSFTGDGHICFRGKNGNKPCTGTPVSGVEAVNGLGAEMDFVAAYKFCEHLEPGVPPPTVNAGTPTAADNMNIKADRDFEALRTAAADECFRALWYRTACPANSQATLKNINAGSNVDCTTTQFQMCARLVWQAPNGLGLSFNGDNPKFASVLASCKAALPAVPVSPLPAPPPNFPGLSPAMYDAMIASKCHDPTYVGELGKVDANASNLERQEQFACTKQEALYRAKMQRERRRLEHEVRNMISLRGMGAETSQTSRISK